MPLSDPLAMRKSIIDFHLVRVGKALIVALNGAALYRATACRLKLGDGMRGHVNKALDYETAPSAHAEYLIVNGTARDQ